MSLTTIATRLAATLPDTTLGSRYDTRENSFNLLRIVLSLMVLYAHSFAVSGSTYRDQLFRISNGTLTFGRVAVTSFFVVSGFLVTQSLLRSEAPRALNYAKNRVLRIMPAIVVCTLVVAFVLGPLMTRRPPGSFFSLVGGWSPWWYTFDTLTFNFFSTVLGWHDRVRDLFVGNPMNAVPNASLWSLRFEVAMYVTLLVVAVVARYRPLIIGGVGVLAAFALWIADARLGISVAHPDFWVLHNYDTLVSMAPYFFAGSAMFAFRHWIPASTGVAAGLAAIGLLSTVTSVGWLVVPLVVPYVVLHLGTARNFAWYGRRVGDYSYGSYILAFPVQQTIVALAGVRNPYLLTLVAMPVTVALAIASWHIVEAPALRLKRRVRARGTVEGLPTPPPGTDGRPADVPASTITGS